jgi:arginine/lysine/ornithine decarboxylase
VALNPTYYGTVPDIEKLCGVCREAECLLIVDEAHGPHFHFHPDLPQAAEDAGADAIVQSTHKVISGLSQAAALHIQGGEIEVPQIRKVLQLFQTTSPNFAIMASIDLARRQMALEGRQRFTEILQLGREARERLSAIDGVRMLEPPRYAKPGAGFFDLDETKLMIDVTRLGRSGEEVHRILRTEFNVQPELSGPTHVLCILTIGSHLSDIDRLVDAMQSIADQSWSGSRHAKHLAAQAGQLVSSTPESELTPREAFCSPTVRVPLNQATGRICAEVVTPYPPGIPALVPGERISDEIVEFLKQVLQSGCPISAAVPSLETLEVIR